MIPLSVLDLATVGSGFTPADAFAQTTSTARAAEAWGYHRLWVAEHHGMPAVASSAPAVLLAHLASNTTSIRLGSGGVMLPNHSPLVVAEQFATLEALHPGRVDLGLGRAPGTDHVTARALRRSLDLTATSFPDDVVELINYLLPRGEATPKVIAMPGSGYLPEVWLLGSSTFSAQLAAHLGLPFSFAYHFAPAMMDAALDQYRADFRPSILLSSPRVMVAASVLCADSADEARRLSASSALSIVQLRTGRLGPLASPEEAAAYAFSPDERRLAEESLRTHVIGDPATVLEGLTSLVARTDADELMLSTRVYEPAARLRSLELVARTWGLTPPSSTRTD